MLLSKEFRTPARAVLEILSATATAMGKKDQVSFDEVLSERLPVFGSKGLNIRRITQGEADELDVKRLAHGQGFMTGRQAEAVLHHAFGLYRDFGRTHDSSHIALAVLDEPVVINRERKTKTRFLMCIFARSLLPSAAGGKVDSTSPRELQAMYAIAPDGEMRRLDNPITGGIPVRQYSM